MADTVDQPFMPSIAQLAAELRGLRDLLNERDVRSKELLEGHEVLNEQRFRLEHEWVDTSLKSANDAVELAMQAASRAVEKAEAASEKRFDSVNEFRATLADQQRTLMPRSEAEVRLGSISNEVAGIVKSLTIRLDALSADVIEIRAIRKGFGEGWGVVVGALSLIVAAVAVAISFAIKH